MNNGRLIIIVPVYNEADRIINTIDGLKSIDSIDEIIVVNDGSTDNTHEIIKKLDISVIHIPENRGKGYAIREGIKGRKYEYVGFVDGDLGLTSNEIEKLIEPVMSNKADFAIAKFEPPTQEMGKQKGFGITKALAKAGVYFYTKKRIETSLSGQRIYKKEVIDSINYIPNRYGIEVAMTIQALINRFSYEEVVVNMSHRYSDRNLKGFMHRGKQFIDILGTLIIMLFKRWTR